jgi:hypothetical protein
MSEYHCKICDVFICPHGSLSIRGKTITCITCNMSPPERFCLPFYEGKVDFESDVFAPVCKACHDKHNRGWN